MPISRGLPWSRSHTWRGRHCTTRPHCAQSNMARVVVAIFVLFWVLQKEQATMTPSPGCLPESKWTHSRLARLRQGTCCLSSTGGDVGLPSVPGVGGFAVGGNDLSLLGEAGATAGTPAAKRRTECAFAFGPAAAGAATTS
eukprot:scaffold84257_cov63-Phaeocystis_antarctica.AAC.3